MGLFSRSGRRRDEKAAADRSDFPDTPYSYGESQPWLKHAVDASWWQENGHYIMAARVGRRAMELAPPEQMYNASTDMHMALTELGRGAEDQAEALSVLVSTVEWLLRSGWLDEPWQSPFAPPSAQAGAAWGVFPGAGIALIRRAQLAARPEILDAYAATIVARLGPMIGILPAWQAAWLRDYQGT